MSKAEEVTLRGLDGEAWSIAFLYDSTLGGLPPDVEPPTLELVHALGRPPDPEAGSMLVCLLERYPAFVPPLPIEARDALFIALLCACEDGSKVPFDIALALRVAGAEATRGFLERLAQRNLSGEATGGLEFFLSCLVDDVDAREVVVQNIGAWPDAPVHAGLKHWVSRHLDPDELRRARLSTP